MSAISILIVDDHAVVRSGLRLLLADEADLEPAGEAANADEAIRGARELMPDVVLLDVGLPGRSGIEALPAIRAASPRSAVLILSMLDDPRYLRAAFAAGASGYVLKDAADRELIGAIRHVHAGGQYVHPVLGALLAQSELETRHASADDPLSEREREVLRLLALGHTNQEIARRLFISVRTAETHRAHIMEKLGISTRAELVRHALSHGVLDPERVG